MAWSQTLLDASYRGVKFDCLRTRDRVQRATASYEYPYVDGADVDDQGRGARDLALSAIFFGDDYELRLQEFIRALDTSGTGELIHPVFGSVPNVQLLDYEIGHDAESPDYCTVELHFNESKTSQPFFTQQLPVQKADAVKAAAEKARFNGIDAFAKAMDKLKLNAALSRLNAMRSVIMGAVGAIRGQIQGVITSVLDVIDFPRAFAADLVGLLGGIADLRSFDTTTLMSDWKSLGAQFGSIVKLPARVSRGTMSSEYSPTRLPGNTKPIAVLPADLALINLAVQVAVATQLADIAADVFAAEAGEPTLSPPEIELIANDVRESLQAAIDLCRNTLPLEEYRPLVESLKDTAALIQSAALAIIEVRPPLILRAVQTPGNLHLIAFSWYGDYTRAAELRRLNPALRNPNFVLAGDVLNAYAS